MNIHIICGARWPSGLERWTGDRTVRGSNPTAENFSLRNFVNSVYPALPVSFGGDTKTLVKAVGPFYLVSMTVTMPARGSKKIPPVCTGMCKLLTVVDSTAHSKLPQKLVTVISAVLGVGCHTHDQTASHTVTLAR